MDCNMPALPVHHQLLEDAQTHVHWVVMQSNHLILCHPLLLTPSIIPSIGVFSNESVLSIRWAKYQGFSFSISPSNKYSGLISFRMDWLDLLAVQGTLKSPNTTVQKHQFSGTQLYLWSNSHIHTWLLETPQLWLDGHWLAKECLCFLICSLGLSYLSSKEQVSFNFKAAVTICSDFGAQENKVSHWFHCFPIYLPWSDGTRCHDLCFLNAEF